MSQLPSNLVVEPFGEVNVFPEGTVLRVKATILMRPTVEGAQTGLAIDGSASMKKAYGASDAVSSMFAAAADPNIVEPVTRTLGAYLANFDSDGQTSVLYWACGVGGMEIEDLGDMTADQIRTRSFPPPKKFGTGTKLLPPLQHFLEVRFTRSPWTILVFITDGAIEDLEAVKTYTLEVARQISAGTRRFVKLVLIGAGTAVDAHQMKELDDLDYGGLKDPQGQEIDLWDHKLASSMQRIEEIFAEVVTSDTLLAPSAVITDSSGQPVKPLDGRVSYADGLPALLHFSVPAGTRSFTLTLTGGKSITQPLI